MQWQAALDFHGCRLGRTPSSGVSVCCFADLRLAHRVGLTAALTLENVHRCLWIELR